MKSEDQESGTEDGEKKIIDVWLSNFYAAIEDIKSLVGNYNYVAMDTEYPGTVYVPTDTENVSCGHYI